jgi:hypothetical protein
MNAESPMPPADFSFFCYSLGAQAMISLGLTEHPVTKRTEADLPQAKHTIDLLEMLKEKTEGNRTDEETKILMSLLYDLRMRYVDLSRAAGVSDEPA